MLQSGGRAMPNHARTRMCQDERPEISYMLTGVDSFTTRETLSSPELYKYKPLRDGTVGGIVKFARRRSSLKVKRP
jgi:hypothetical protein